MTNAFGFCLARNRRSPKRPSEPRLSGVHPNNAEWKRRSGATVDSALSLFQRGIVGAYQKMSRDHLDGYLQEFCWRLNGRHMLTELFDLALHNMSERKPPLFKKLTREVC